MEAFYSIIYYKINTATDEMVSVALLGGGGEGPYLYISKTRLDFLQKIIHPNTFLSLNRHLKSLQEKVDVHRNETAGLLLFDPVFSEEQLKELSKQTKRAILYSKPTTINDWLNEQAFTKLVNLLFKERIVKKEKRRPVFQIQWKAFYQSDRFNQWKRDIALYELKPKTGLTISVDLVDLTKNQVYKGLDFDLSEAYLKSKVYEVELIANALIDYTITIVSPNPLTKSGKAALKSTQEKFKNIKFIEFNVLKKKG